MQPGDKVQWTHTSTRGRTFSMVLREGEFVTSSFGIATVRRKNGKEIQIHEQRLTLKGQRTRLDEVVEAIRSQ